MSGKRTVARKRVFSIIVMALGATVGGALSVGAATEDSEIEGVPWVLDQLLVDGDLSDAPDDVLATLLIEAGHASGSGGCNSYSGSYTLDGASLTFTPLAATAMLCSDPVMSTETAFQDALGRVTSYEIDRGGLQLLDRSGERVLVFESGEVPSIEGSWIVASFVTDGRDLLAPLPGSVLTAVFGADGTLEGSSGCNHFTGPFVADGSAITVGALSSTSNACASPELQQQEAHYLAALAASDAWSQEGTDLELADSAGLGSDTTVRLTAAIEPTYVGAWDVTGFDMGNGSLIAPLPGTTLSAVFGVEGTIDGNSGCNTYAGPASVSGWSMTVGPLATTRVACADAAVETQEQQYLAALQLVTSWANDADGIVLRDIEGVTKVTLAPPQDGARSES